MINVIYSPQWFVGSDIVIDIISLIVVSIIAFFSWKFYKIDKTNKKQRSFAYSFFIIAVSFVMKIISYFTIYYVTTEVRQIGYLVITFDRLHVVNTLLIVGILLHRLLMLLGIFLLYWTYQDSQPKPVMFIVFYLLLISTYVSEELFYIFHFTLLLLLILITARYINNYKKTNHETTRWLAASFALIATSHLLFLFLTINSFIFVLAELLQLGGYVLLLVTVMKVLWYDTKKR